MRLASHAVVMASISAAGLTLTAYGGEPLPDGWLDGIVAPGSTVGGAVAILGTWAVGVGTTLLGGALLARLAWDAWHYWQGLHPKGRQSAAR